MALLEVCCGSLESVDAAVAGGARRIELCAALEVDGLTPPIEWLQVVKDRYPSLVVHVLIRPRAGDFAYAPEEVDTMAVQTEQALEAGADGIVIGALTATHDLDEAAMEQLMKVVEEGNLARELAGSDLCHSSNDHHFFPDPAKTATVTFHRAFDVCRRPFEALEKIIALGCSRILTSGQGPTVTEGSDMLRELRKRAEGRMIILPGGGVTPTNAARILRLTGCTEIHASASEVIDGKKITSAARVAAILQAIQSI
jgi:copper homeostasis protein